MSSISQSQLLHEETLVQQAVNGDLEAFNQLVLAYQNLAYHHAFALLGDRDLAEDATQDSFIRAFQAMQGFRGGSLRGWLLKIVTNSAYDLLRRSYRHPSQPLFPEDENGENIESPRWLEDPQASIPRIAEQNELSKDLYKAIDSLPDVYRTVITLIDLYEFDYTEAAEALQVPIGTVKSRLARARLRMKEKLLSDPAVCGTFGASNLCLAI
jgi:RNA polymerase sigma-70 factor, ECF subfamily